MSNFPFSVLYRQTIIILCSGNSIVVSLGRGCWTPK